MSKKLTELFQLPDDETSQDESILPSPNEIQEVTQEALTNLEKIENALPQVKGLESSDTELDELAELATSSFKDLQDLGMQVDSRFSAEIFGVAGNMLGHAITAKTAKINKKLKMIELQLRKAALDQKTAAKTEEVENTPLGNGQMLDRNELLKVLSGKNDDK